MGMGCSHGGTQTRTVTILDPRVPFTSAELEIIRAFWWHVKRKFEDTAREMLIRWVNGSEFDISNPVFPMQE